MKILHIPTATEYTWHNTFGNFEDIPETGYVYIDLEYFAERMNTSLGDQDVDRFLATFPNVYRPKYEFIVVGDANE